MRPVYRPHCQSASSPASFPACSFSRCFSSSCRRWSSQCFLLFMCYQHQPLTLTPSSPLPLARLCCCSCSCIFRHRQIFLLSYHSHAFTIIACKFQAFKKSAQKTLTKSTKKLKNSQIKARKMPKNINRQKSRQVPRFECV